MLVQMGQEQGHQRWWNGCRLCGRRWGLIREELAKMSDLILARVESSAGRNIGYEVFIRTVSSATCASRWRSRVSSSSSRGVGRSMVGRREDGASLARGTSECERARESKSTPPRTAP